MSSRFVHPFTYGHSLARALILLLVLLRPGMAAADLSQTVQFNIAPQSLSSALVHYTEQSGVQVTSPAELVDDKSSPGVVGRLQSRGALERLLVGTDLSYNVVGQNTVTLHLAADSKSATPPAQNSKSASSATEDPSSRRAATALTAASTREMSADPSPAGAGAAEYDPQTTPLEEVVVTGSNIRGVEPVSQVLTFTHADIERNGFSSAVDLIKSIPQNFNGGASTTTIGSIAGGGNSNNSTSATGVNLRGLGNDATLVLLDGHRIAPGNSSGNFVDISMIPLSAIERVEIVPDGASAIYGSDAVGGVINFIMRKQFDGAETQVRDDNATSGSYRQLQASQTAGTHWNNGSALLSYEFQDQTPLSAADRSYTQTASLPFNLVPSEIRHGVLATANQFLTPDVELFADATYAHRDSVDSFAEPGYANVTAVQVSAYSGLAGVRMSLPHDARFELSANYGASDSRQQEQETDLIPSKEIYAGDTKSSIFSIDAKIDGTLAWGLAGPLRFAVGGQYRRDTLDVTTSIPRGDPEFDPGRTVLAAFTELDAPLIGPSRASSGPNRLELSVAGRVEHYSDFGTSANPKVGLSWRPWSALKLRGTYGTSFVAPQLYDLNPALVQAAAISIADPTTGGRTNAILLSGGNANLQPQKATTYTLGADFQPESLAGLRAQITYYDIRYRDRIASLQDTGFSNIFTALLNEATLGPAIVERNPSSALIEQLQASPVYVNFSGQTDPVIGAIIDNRKLNLSAVHTSGLDLNLSYRMLTDLGTVEWGADGTYIAQLDNQFTASSPSASIVNTVYNPTRVKLRTRTLFQHGPVTGAVFLNYVNDYRDNTGTKIVPVASWTTVDANASYTVGREGGWLNNLVIRLGVNNAFNRAPPYVFNSSAALVRIYYDGANASPLGRVVYGQLIKRW